MIQANELRIGNFVKFNSIKEKTEIDEYDFEDVLNGYFTDIEPIPITEEKLMMFGFEQYIDFGIKTNIFDLMPLCGFSYDIVTKQVTIFEMEEGNKISHCIKRKIEYVHELQNLYFALRGKELTPIH